MNLTEILNWRYATKAMTNEIIPDEKINSIMSVTLLCPSSSGLQPFNIILISNQELKKKISPIAMNQPVIEQSSHLMVFAAWDSYTEERINHHFYYINKQRGMPGSTTDNYRKMLLKLFEKQTPQQHFQHAAKQSYIGLGYATIAAANEQVDATPMEGFNPEALDELLELKKQGLKSTAILALGYRDIKTDWLVKLKKVREPLSEFVTIIK
ncbi:MAG: nitroreductase family protein [Ferruginibacter sp.]